MENTGILKITTEQGLTDLWASSKRCTVLILKHSTTCSISAAAYSAFTTFATRGHEHLKVAIILVKEDRSVSDLLAELSGIKHQSPQALLIQNETVVWHASHWDISMANLTQAVVSNEL